MFTNEEVIKAHGPYAPPAEFTDVFIRSKIAEIKNFPSELKSFFAELKPEHQDARYRDGGWTFRQIVHHLADSHMQAFSRFKLALTEHNPIIKPYIQNAWAETSDSLHADAGISVELVTLIHHRFSILMEHMNKADFERTYIHPEQGKTFSLEFVCGMYAWHGNHHLTQMKRHAFNMGWINSAD